MLQQMFINFESIQWQIIYNHKQNIVPWTYNLQSDYWKIFLILGKAAQ